MLTEQQVNKIKENERSLTPIDSIDPDLGPFKLLSGTWTNKPSLKGRGWNLIALPSNNELKYRLLLNQYNEELKFTLVDKGVPNRGSNTHNNPDNFDQFIVALDYEQTINQKAAKDYPQTNFAGGQNLPIHHEPGLFLYMINSHTNNLNIARTANVPHGNSVLALGKFEVYEGAPIIEEINALPSGVSNDLNDPFLKPYKHFIDEPLKNKFSPQTPNELLKTENQSVNILRTTELEFDTNFESGGIINIPFIEKEANATEMKCKFWIQELDELDQNGNPKIRLQYTQTVILEFLSRHDGMVGHIRWPHISINTLEKSISLT